VGVGIKEFAGRLAANGAGRRVWAVLSWAVPLGFLVWAVRLVAVEGFLNELPKGFSGDFNSAVTGAGIDDWWAGQGLFYGPLFVLEWLVMLHPGYVSIVEVAFLDIGLFAIAFTCAWLALFGRVRPRLLLLVLGAWLGNYASVALFATAQHLEALELMWLSLALLLMVRARPRAAGVSLGLAIATKTLPFVFLPYLAVLRRWRTLGLAAGVAAALFLGTCLVQGVSPWDGAVMLLNQGSNLAKTKSTPYELGLRAFFIRLLTNGQGDPTPAQADLAFALHGVVAVATAAATAWIVWRASPIARGLGLAWGLVAATMLVVAPVTHIFYFVFLLPGFTAVLAELVERPLGWVTGIHWLGLLASYVFTGFDQPFVLAQRFLGLGQVALDHWLDFLPLALLLSIAVQASMLHLYYSPRPTSNT
jgi:alpha-1,2-mannosyltransferase